MEIVKITLNEFMKWYDMMTARDGFYFPKPFHFIVNGHHIRNSHLSNHIIIDDVNYGTSTWTKVITSNKTYTPREYTRIKLLGLNY